MSDDTARRDAWRNAQTATTVTGDRTGGEPPREHEGEDIHLPNVAQVSATKAPEVHDGDAAVAAYDVALAEGNSITEANAAGLAAGRSPSAEGEPVTDDQLAAVIAHTDAPDPLDELRDEVAA